MEVVLGGVLVALIGGGGPLMWFLSRFDKKNTLQHDKNLEVLSRVENQVGSLDKKIDHIESKVIHVDTKIMHVENKIIDVHDRVASLEKPKTTRTRVKSV